jgi:hypothetical protein
MLGIGNDHVIAFTLITVAIADNESDKLQHVCNKNSCLHTFFKIEIELMRNKEITSSYTNILKLCVDIQGYS